MVSKLKKLSEDDLADISDYFSNLIYKKINYTVDSPKEIINMDVDIDVSYNEDDGELDVDVDVDIQPDELSSLSDEIIEELIDESYDELDEYINENYR